MDAVSWPSPEVVASTRRHRWKRRNAAQRTGRSDSCAVWTSVTTGRTCSSSWVVVRNVVVYLAIAGVMAGWLFTIVRDSVRWENLRSRGRSATAVVVSSTTVDEGDNGYKYYVYAEIVECACMVKVRVATLADHDVGSEIPVRYDPRDHSNAVPLVDRPANGLGASIGFYIITLGASGWGLVYVLRRRQRNRGVLGNPTSKRAVRFEAWRRKAGDASQHYLVLFDAAACENAAPLCCVPVSQRSLRRLDLSDVLQFYESGDLGSPAALRREGNVLLPTGRIKPGSWELAKRRK